MQNNTDFQTPPALCDHMSNMICDWKLSERQLLNGTILEPTPAAGNLEMSLRKMYPLTTITAPKDFWQLYKAISPPAGVSRTFKYDYIVMNPPFTPMIQGWEYLSHCMQLSDHIVALLPWFIMINSKKRSKAIMDFGLVSITHLPRETFPNTRIQCCLLHMKKGFTGETIFKTFEFDNLAY